MDLASLIQFAVEQKASDLHLQVGAPPMIRIAGTIHEANVPPLSQAEMEGLVLATLPTDRQSELPSVAVTGLDFSYAHPNSVARFRCSAYSTRGRLGMVMRVIRSDIPTFEQLHLPKVMSDIALAQRGLTLVTGTTGSGKSTTLAAMIDLINQTHRAKIITIEDPIEYIHPNKKSIVTQIEVGTDTKSFDQALRQALRQDPDVVLVGELRDIETLRMALRAADTGHQVFATVHSARAAQTVERIIAMFPPAEHKLLLSQLAHSIEAIISQRLVPTRDGGRRPALEILRGGPVTEKYIMEGRINELSEYVDSGESGMRSFDQDLLQMYNERLISGTEAMRHANRPEAFAIAMRGIRYVGSAAAASNR
jgi:twitching motility protein PilT